MRNSSAEIAGDVADAGARYVEERWLSELPEHARTVWRARINDVLYTATVHAIEQHEKARRRRQKKRRKVLLVWCLTCRAQLKMPKRERPATIRCRTCGNVQAVPGQGSNG